MPPDDFENAILTNGQANNVQYGSYSNQASQVIASSFTGTYVVSATLGDLGFIGVAPTSFYGGVDSATDGVSNSIGSSGGGSIGVQDNAPNNSPKSGSFPWGWPFNGNMLPLKPGTQDNKCTTGPLEGPIDRNPAVLSCAKHTIIVTQRISATLPHGYRIRYLGERVTFATRKQRHALPVRY